MHWCFECIVVTDVNKCWLIDWLTPPTYVIFCSTDILTKPDLNTSEDFPNKNSGTSRTVRRLYSRTSQVLKIMKPITIAEFSDFQCPTGTTAVICFRNILRASWPDADCWWLRQCRHIRWIEVKSQYCNHHLCNAGKRNRQWLKWGGSGGSAPAPIWAPCNSMNPTPWLNL